MGVMSTAHSAYLEHKKQPFLKALLRFGKVAPSARAVRISRDAVYDWLRSDENFRREYNRAKKQRFDGQTTLFSESLDFFLDTIKPIIPPECFPRVVAAVNLTVSQRQFKEAVSAFTHGTSRNRSRLPSFDVHPESANSDDDGSLERRTQGKNGHLT